MTEQMKAERDRLKVEQDYLMSRVIETNLNLQATLEESRETFTGLQALERIKLLKAGAPAELFQVSDNRIYELVRTRGLPAIPFGDHQLRFDPIAARRWLDEGDASLLKVSQANRKQVTLEACEQSIAEYHKPMAEIIKRAKNVFLVRVFLGRDLTTGKFFTTTRPFTGRRKTPSNTPVIFRSKSIRTNMSPRRRSPSMSTSING